MREISYEGSSEKDLENFPTKEIEKFVHDLDMLRDGLEAYLTNSKPMKGLGQGVRELKKNGRPAYRVVYVIRGNVVHVLHAFSKTSSGTDKKHEDTIKLRFKNL